MSEAELKDRNLSVSDDPDQAIQVDEGIPQPSGEKFELPEHVDVVAAGAPERVEVEVGPPTQSELEDADRKIRRQRRRRLVLWGTPFAVILALIALKLLSMIFIANQAVGQYEAGHYEESLNTSELLTTGNVVEPWKAHYNVGTNYLQLGVLTEARLELEQALRLAAPTEACPVRANLAIAVERLGDNAQAEGDDASARDLYEQAQVILAERDPSCWQSTSHEVAEETQRRLDEKSPDATSVPVPTGSPTPIPSPDASGTPMPTEGSDPTASTEPPVVNEEAETPEQQLEEQLGENQQQREEQLDEENNSSSGGAEKPW